MMLLGALVCWGGQHLLAFLRVVDVVAAEAGFVGADAAERALASIERVTSESGVWAYLTFVSSGSTAALSPIGLLGRLELGALGTILVAVGELGLLGVSAAYSLLYRTRAIRQPPDGPVAWFDEPSSDDAITALQTRRFDELGEIALRSRGRPVHTLVIEEGAVTAELTLCAVDAFTRPTDRILTKSMPLADARALREQLLLARRRIETESGAPDAAAGGPNGARDP
jgi:hypothetical protein